MSELLIGIDAFDLLAKQGFTVLRSVLVQDEHAAAQVASTIGFPVTLKISSVHAVHKTEVGGVLVGLSSGAAVAEGFRHVVRSFESRNSGVRADGVIVQKQGDGFELIVGVINDQQFGPVIMFGLGGIFAEAMQDVSFRLIPIETSDAVEMIEELRGYEAIRRPRKGSIDIEGIQNFLVDISKYIVNHPQIQEMDLNPVFASPAGIEICDARIRLRR